MVKGAVIREFLGWYTDRYGKERLVELMANAPPDLRPYLDDPATLLAASWYPARLGFLILDKITEGVPESHIAAMSKEAARVITKRQASGAYRFFLEKLVTPQVYAVSVPHMWRQLHSTGVRQMKITAPKVAESIVRDWTGHHPVFCTITLETMCAIFEMMGCKDVRYKRISCVSRGGAKECKTELYWR